MVTLVGYETKLGTIQLVFGFQLSLTIFNMIYSMVDMYTKLHKTMDVLNFFTTRSWEWTYTNNDLLTSQLSSDDKQVSCLSCDVG